MWRCGKEVFQCRFFIVLTSLKSRAGFCCFSCKWLPTSFVSSSNRLVIPRSFSRVRFLCCSSFNPPMYASNELASRFILLPGHREAPTVSGLFDAIGLHAAEELVATRQEEQFIESRDLDTILSPPFCS